MSLSTCFWGPYDLLTPCIEKANFCATLGLYLIGKKLSSFEKTLLYSFLLLPKEIKMTHERITV